MDLRGSARRARAWLAILVPLALGLVFSSGLAYQTWDASREHRRTAEATVRDHAAFAAHLVASRIAGRVQQSMLYAFYGVDLAIRAGAERWPEVDALRTDQEIGRCDAVRPGSERVFFRWVEGGALDILGPANDGLRGWLDSWIPEAARRRGAERPYGLRFGAPGIGPEGVAFRVFRTPAQAVVYGLDNCFRDLEVDLISEVLAEPAVLPPTLVGDTPNDSLFRVIVTNGAGQTVRGDPVGGRDEYVGRADLEPVEVYGGLSVELRLADATARRLVIGGMPRSRLPEALTLVALTALLLGVAALQLRRGQELVRLRERFVANVSHELRTPLQQILLFSDLLRLGRVADEAERAGALAVIHRETGRLIGLVENVLAFSRLDRDEATPPLHVRDTALLELTRDVVESFRPMAEERGARLEVGGEEVVVEGDPGALRRVLINLLDNAVKYGPDGQTIRIVVGRSGGAGRVSVEDEGPGIPDDARQRIWEPHVRLERDEERGRSGHGVGLAIVRDLVERMRGRVSIDDTRDGGASFSIVLPPRAP